MYHILHNFIEHENGTGFIAYAGSPELCKLKDQPEGKGENVKLTTLDSLAAANDIDSFDIIKMDAEGHEQKILRGAEKIIAEKSPIIFYEYTDGSNINSELTSDFSDIGYDSYYYVSATSTLYKHRKEFPVDQSVLNLIAVKPESLHRFEGIAKIDDAENHARLGNDVLQNFR